MATHVYKAIEKAFYNGMIYEPNGKRPFLVTEKPLKPVPDHFKMLKNRCDIDAALGTGPDPEAEAKAQAEHDAELAAVEADSRGPEEL